MDLQTKRNAMMNSIKSGGRLPSEYQEVEYIQNVDNGGLPYIDTGIPPKDTYVYEFEFEIVRILRTSATYFGGGSAWQFAVNLNEDFSSGAGIRSYWGTVLLQIAPKSEIGVKYEFEIAQRYFRRNNTTATRWAQATNFQPTVYLFNRNYGTGQPTGDIAILKWYSYSVKENGDYVQNLIPCYRKSDNEVGMYDLVNNQFLINQGTGTFTKGNDV